MAAKTLARLSIIGERENPAGADPQPPGGLPRIVRRTTLQTAHRTAYLKPFPIMNRRDFGKSLLGFAAVPAFTLPALSPDRPLRWSFTATLAECCSCEIPCPCNFGRPTDQGCFGNRLIRFQDGSYEGVDLAGAAFLVTFSMGVWTRLYIDESLPAAQQDAVDGVLAAAFGGFERAARVKRRVPMTIRETGSGLLTFTTPESSVEMKRMEGLNGQPIRIDGLPNPAYADYVQWESVSHRHGSEDAEWNYSGTNGFTSVMRAQG